MILINRSALFLAAIAAVLAVSCGGRSPATASSTATSAPAGPVATVVTALAETGPVEETLESFGTVEFDPHETRTIPFVKSGQVAQVLVTPGQPVAEGDPLLKPGPLPSSSVEVEQARIDLQYAEQNLGRIRRLRQTHLATNEAEQQAERSVATARAALEGLGVDGSGGPRIITAPFSGVVVRVLVTSGRTVHPGEDAMLVAPADGLAVRAGFEPEDAVRLRAGMEVRIAPVFGTQGDSPARAILSGLHRVVDPRTQLVQALIRPAGIPKWMVAGTRVRVRVVLRSARDAVRIPRGSMVKRRGEKGVFVVERGTAHWRPVAVGIQNRRWIEVRSGLEPGAEVVTTGRTSLADGMNVTTAPTRGG